MFDYISVLAGGNCPIDCVFCVGAKIRQTEREPYFASWERIEFFLECYGRHSKQLSISGSTSDPLFIDEKLLMDICRKAKKMKLRISIHFCIVNDFLGKNFDFFDKLVLSLHEYPNKEITNFVKANAEKVRVSSVYYSNNYGIFDDFSFFRKVPCTVFTVRKNVFNPRTPEFIKKLKPIDTIFNQAIYEFHDKKIAVWDYADANQYINARYLWPSGEIRRQCYWHSLY